MISCLIANYEMLYLNQSISLLTIISFTFLQSRFAVHLWLICSNELLGPNYHGRVLLDQNFRQFRCKIERNRKFPETRFENSGQALEVFHFSGNLDISEIFSAIWPFHPLRLVPISTTVNVYQNTSIKLITRWRRYQICM